MTEKDDERLYGEAARDRSSSALPARDGLITRIVQRVAELPDRTSPDDWPDAMLVTADELRAILADELEAAVAAAGRETSSRDELDAILRNILGPLDAAVTDAIEGMGEYARQTMSATPEFVRGIRGLEEARRTVRRWQADPRPSSAETAPDEPDVQLLAWAVSNCHTLARRALARSTSTYDREKWEHVQRICEKAGARSAGQCADEREAVVPPSTAFSEWWVCFRCWIAYHVPTTGVYATCSECGKATQRWPTSPMSILRMTEWKRASSPSSGGTGPQQQTEPAAIHRAQKEETE